MTHNVPSVFFHVTCCFPNIEQYCSSDMSISQDGGKGSNPGFLAFLKLKKHDSRRRFN